MENSITKKEEGEERQRLLPKQRVQRKEYTVKREEYRVKGLDQRVAGTSRDQGSQSGE